MFDGKSMAEDSQIQIKNGNYIGKLDVKGDYNHLQIDKVEAGAEVTNKKVVESPIVQQTALEVQNLLVQLSGDKPLESKREQMAVAVEAVEVIEAKPEFKGRIISALKAGGVAAFEKIDHPAISFVLAAVEDWQDKNLGDTE